MRTASVFVGTELFGFISSIVVEKEDDVSGLYFVQNNNV